MQLEKTTHDAVKILRYLHANPGKQKTKDIADALGISTQLVTRLMARLKRDKLVLFAIGRDGGYTLGRPAEEISFYDMLVAAEGELSISHCFKEGICQEDGHCKAHDYLMQMQTDWADDMMGVNLADLG